MSAVIALLIALLMALQALMAGPPSPTDRCWEDEPCWDCHTMGNRICGPTVDQGDNDT